ncbi:cation diffusion facilitator family transporter [Paracoccus sp. TK19116]|uniref:Cation diffusion facilitator family transporter n=1 Tax=Paracoccus albicereus TaxID=2922394 RepID=A0ABT1MSX2_9RHOB|nr:cation diffusion facilitator family transporter [Paracoccus albicereus]MCQ0970819.1 cation diffusion facilitator family transporter [Paracoccus albicereus]
MDRSQQAALGSVGIGLLVFALKLYAWYVTGSIALYSDALESIINVVAAGAAFVALRVASIPADSNHPYGHHKAEYFSAVFEGVLVVLAALAILREAWQGWFAPAPIDAPALGLAINGTASLINGVWAAWLMRRGRALRSPALMADARHILTDVWTSAGVIIGVILVTATGIERLDPAIAALVALNILWQGWTMTREAAGGLMDKAPDEAIVQDLKQSIARNAEGAIEAHDVRIRHAGAMTFIEFHLIVPGEMSVADSHAICDRIEAALRDALDAKVNVHIHVEPEHKAKHDGIVVL